MVVVDRLICDDGTRWGRSRSHSGGRHATSGADDAPSLSHAKIFDYCVRRSATFGMPEEGMRFKRPLNDLIDSLEGVTA